MGGRRDPRVTAIRQIQASAASNRPTAATTVALTRTPASMIPSLYHQSFQVYPAAPGAISAVSAVPHSRSAAHGKQYHINWAVQALTKPSQGSDVLAGHANLQSRGHATSMEVAAEADGQHTDSLDAASATMLLSETENAVMDTLLDLQEVSAASLPHGNEAQGMAADGVMSYIHRLSCALLGCLEVLGTITADSSSIQYPLPTRHLMRLQRTCHLVQAKLRAARYSQAKQFAQQEGLKLATTAASSVHGMDHDLEIYLAVTDCIRRQLRADTAALRIASASLHAASQTPARLRESECSSTAATCPSGGMGGTSAQPRDPSQGPASCCAPASPGAQRYAAGALCTGAEEQQTAMFSCMAGTSIMPAAAVTAGRPDDPSPATCHTPAAEPLPSSCADNDGSSLHASLGPPASELHQSAAVHVSADGKEWRDFLGYRVYPSGMVTTGDGITVNPVKRRGQWCISLKLPSRRKEVLLRRLVAHCWLPGFSVDAWVLPTYGLDVDYKDGNSDNCIASNLFIVQLTTCPPIAKAIATQTPGARRPWWLKASTAPASTTVDAGDSGKAPPPQAEHYKGGASMSEAGIVDKRRDARRRLHGKGPRAAPSPLTEC